MGWAYGPEPRDCSISMSFPRCSFRAVNRYLHLPNPPAMRTYCDGKSLVSSASVPSISASIHSYLWTLPLLDSDCRHLFVNHGADLADGRVESSSNIIGCQCNL